MPTQPCSLSFRAAVTLCLAACAVASALAQHRVYVEFESGVTSQRLSVGSATADVRRAAVDDHEVAVYANSPLSAEEWRRVPGVRAAYRDIPVRARGERSATALVPDDPGFPGQWNMRIIDAPAAWDVTTGGTSATGQDIVIAVVESNGFPLDHPELRNRFFLNPGEIGDNGIDDDRNGYVDDVTGWNFARGTPDFEPDNHGAHVAATLAARSNNGAQTAGLNWDATLLPFQVSTIGEWTLALDYIADLRERYNATDGRDGAYIVVANMSLGADGIDCGEWPPFNAALQRLGAAGVLSVAAAGNGGGDASVTPDFPTSCESEFLVMVTATDSTDRIWRNSGFGETQVDLAAPGAPYASIDYLVGGRVENTFSGTSGAAPHVAGVAALAYALPDTRLDFLVANDPEAGALLVRDALLRGVDLVDALDGLVLSNGRLNAAGTLAYVREVLAADGSLIVFLAPSATPPELIPTTKAADTVEFVRTLGASVGAHLYARRAPLPGPIIDDSPGEVTVRGEVLAVARNVPVRIAIDPSLRADTEVRSDVARLRLPGVAVANAAAPVSPAVVALFADGFGVGGGASGYGRLGDEAFARAPGEIADNDLDDDANGFVDDVSGRALDASSPVASPASGGRGGQLAYVIGAEDQDLISGSILPLTGGTLADLVAGADYALEFRRKRNEGVAGGQRVVAYAAPVQTSALFDGTAALVHLAEVLLGEGLVLIAPSGLVGGPEGSIALGGERYFVRASPEEVEAAVPAVAAYDEEPLEGAGAGVALAAAAVQRLFSRTCAGDEPSVDPRATATEVLEALTASQWRAAGAPSDDGDPAFDATQASLRLSAACPGVEVELAAASVFPNPLPAGATLRIEVLSLSVGPATVQVFDMAGSRVYEGDVSSDGELVVVDLPTAGWPAGGYVVRVLGSAGDAVVTKVLSEGAYAP